MSQSSPFPSCFRPSSAAASDANHHHHRPPSPPPPPPPPLSSGKPNLATSFYQTELGVFSLAWSRTFLGHSLHLNLHNHDGFSSAASSLSFHLHIKPFVFWKKHGSKRLLLHPDDAADLVSPKFQIYWDLSRAKFGSGPEPQSGFYIAVLADREIVLLVGDLTKEAWAKTKALRRPGRRRTDNGASSQSLVSRKEHVFGNRVYSTRARFGGRNRQISIDCSDGRLNFAVDSKKVLQIKRLKWKFRGNERIEVDGVPIQISWDVYNWLFDSDGNSSSSNSGAKHALFMFRFEAEEEEAGEYGDEEEDNGGDATPPPAGKSVESWKQHQSNSPWRKVKRSLMMKNTGARSSSWSSVSVSSVSSSMGTNTSVMEWASVEESELGCGPDGFSLLVYAWKK
ncbi:hypothetical protein LINGRAHAP2_LOCUS6111 [Linum grandiflorum]